MSYPVVRVTYSYSTDVRFSVVRVGNLSPAIGARNQVGRVVVPTRQPICSLAAQFQTRFLESIPRPIMGLTHLTLLWMKNGELREASFIYLYYF
jgi:hypothetical protein